MSEPTSGVTSAEVVRGGAWAMLSTIVPQLYTFVTSVVIARLLGADGVGRIAFIAFVTETLAILLVGGMPQALMRYVSETLGQGHAGMIRSLTRSMTRFFLVSASIGLTVLLLASFLGAQPRGAWIFAAVICAGSILHGLPSAFLQGTRRWRDAVIVGMTTGAVGVVAKVIALLVGGGITHLFAIDAVIVWCNVAGTSLLARRAARRLLPAAEPAGDLLRRVIRFAAIGSLSIVISLVLYRRSEIFFLVHYSTDQQIALYSVPFSIVLTLIMLPRAMGAVIAPTVATLFGAGEHERIRSGFRRSTRLALLFGVLATVGGAVVGPSFIRLLYGPEFTGASPVLIILLATVPFVPLMGISQALLVGIRRQWVPTAVIAAAAAANIALDWALIPPFDAVGAAVANSTAQLLAAVPLTLYAASCLGGGLHVIDRALLRGVGAVLVAGLAGGVVVVLLPDLGALIVGSVVYVCVALPLIAVLRVLSDDDVEWLEGSLATTPAAPLARAVRVASQYRPSWAGASR